MQMPGPHRRDFSLADLGSSPGPRSSVMLEKAELLRMPSLETELPQGLLLGPKGEAFPLLTKGHASTKVLSKGACLCSEVEGISPEVQRGSGSLPASHVT